MTPDMGSGTARGRWTIMAIVAVFILSLAIIDPRGNFPLNDDWSFAASTRRLVFEHRWLPTGWASMPLITHALWGSVACQLSSCSDESLRAAGILAGGLLLMSSYVLFRRIGAAPWQAGMAGLLVVLNPISAPLMTSFMTETFFELMLVVSLLLLVSALRTGHWRWILLGTIAVIAATLCRQLGLCVSIGFAIAFWFHSREAVLPRTAKALVPLVASILVYLIYQRWMQDTGRLPALYDQKSQQLMETLHLPAMALARTLVRNTVVMAIYAGLLSAPVALIGYVRISAGLSARTRMAVGLACLVISALLCAALFHSRSLMPMASNILVPEGIGPLTLRDVYIYHMPGVPALSDMFWLIVTFIGCSGACLLAVDLAIIALRRGRAVMLRSDVTFVDAITLFGVFATAAYFAPLVIGGFFDRYVAVVLPVLFMPLLVSGNSVRMPRAMMPVLAAATIFIVTFGVLGTHDYISWNRARWQALTVLQNRSGLGPAQIDGGLEYNGTYLYDPAYRETNIKSWWWVRDDLVRLSFSPMADSTVIGRFPYTTYLPYAQRYIYVSKRKYSAIAPPRL